MVFDTLPGKKIPTIKMLQTEYETQLAERKKPIANTPPAQGNEGIAHGE
ncbi:MAG: hypothetical protein AAGU74_00795 [Bacillota bacterium]